MPKYFLLSMWVLLSVGHEPTSAAYAERGALFYIALTTERLTIRRLLDSTRRIYPVCLRRLLRQCAFDSDAPHSELIFPADFPVRPPRPPQPRRPTPPPT